MRLTSRLLLPVLFVLLAGCDPDPGETGSCSPLSCAPGEICDAASGECRARDAGSLVPTDGGDPDAGAIDGGSSHDGGAEDAGQPDAGADDAGTDAGTDAGERGCTPTSCEPPLFCDPAADGGFGACVTCNVLQGCTSPTPACDTSVPGGRCVACVDDGECFGLTPVCDPSSNTCVGCLGPQDCGGTVPFCDTASRTCVECQSDGDCTTSPYSLCDPTKLACVECVSNTDCANPNPICDASAQLCVPCTSASECGAGFSCTSGSCQPIPDTCATAQTINIPPGTSTITLHLDTTGAADDESGSCLTNGADLVFALVLSETQDVSFLASAPTGSGVDPALMLQASPCGGGVIGCFNVFTGATAESGHVPMLPAGTYYLIVETAGMTAGPIDLTIEATTVVVPPANDTCSGARALTFNGGVATATGTTVGASNGNGSNASTPTCSTSARQTGDDVVYSFTLATAQDVTIAVTPTGTSPTLWPAVYVRGPAATKACDSDTQLGCAEASNATLTELRLPKLAPGTYHLIVDEAFGTSGDFQLEVRLDPPTTNDACSGATPLTFSSGAATAVGDTRFATNTNGTNDASPSCSSTAKSTGADLVYSYTLTQPQDVTVTLTPLGSSAIFQPVLYVRAPGACASTSNSDELGCSAASSPTPRTLQFVAQPAGTYFIWVDTAGGNPGPFQLDVSLAPATPPPANDECPGTPLTFTTSGVIQAVASGTTATATNSQLGGDAVPTCAVSAVQSGKDVIHSYTLTQPQDVTITVLGATPGFKPVLYVKKGSCGSFAISDELACTLDDGSGTAGTTLLNQPAGTYWIYVDGLHATSGSYTLGVQLDPPTPPPANDTCAGAPLLTFTNGTVTTSGDTSTATNDNTAADSSPTCAPTAKQKGKDVVYRYSLTSPTHVKLVATPSGGGNPFIPVLYVRGPGAIYCDSISAGAEQGCAAAPSAGPVTLNLPNQPAGDYAVHVDGASVTSGPFTLAISQHATPSNDTCSAPTPVVPGTPLTGDTAFARDDYSGTSTPAYSLACQNVLPYPLTGTEVVYAFTETTSGTRTLTVVPEPDFDPAVLVLTGSCSPASCLTGVDTPGAGKTESLTFSTTAGQTYYFIVDNYDPTKAHAAGIFTLTLQ